MDDLSKARVLTRRWRILSCLHSARPVGAAETLIRAVLDDAVLSATTLEVRQDLDYLAGKKLLTIRDEEEAVWVAEITSDGVDVVEGTVKCPPGITRPRG